MMEDERAQVTDGAWPVFAGLAVAVAVGGIVLAEVLAAAPTRMCLGVLGCDGVQAHEAAALVTPALAVLASLAARRAV